MKSKLINSRYGLQSKGFLAFKMTIQMHKIILLSFHSNFFNSVQSLHLTSSCYFPHPYQNHTVYLEIVLCCLRGKDGVPTSLLYEEPFQGPQGFLKIAMLAKKNCRSFSVLSFLRFTPPVNHITLCSLLSANPGLLPPLG